MGKNKKSNLPSLLLREAIHPNREQVQHDTNLILNVQRVTLEVMADILEHRGIMTRPQTELLTIDILNEFTRRVRGETSQENQANK